MLESWHISRSKGACSACGAQFAPDQLFFSALAETGGEFARQDFCRTCWDMKDSDAFFCFWQTRRAPAEPKRAVKTELLLEFFDRLKRPDGEQKRTFRFVLALYLMRRKELKLLRTERRGETEALLFERRSSGRKVEVENPGLNEEQIQQTAARLSQLFDAGL